MNYEEYLSKMYVVSEQSFNELLSKIPIHDEYVDFNGVDDLQSLAEAFIQAVLNNWPSVWCSRFDLDNLSFSLCDIESIEDLQEIDNTFSSWTISNYSDILKDLQESVESQKIRTLIISIQDGLSKLNPENLLKVYNYINTLL